MVNCAAAARLKELVGLVNESQRRLAIAELARIYLDYGDRSARTDKDWGYRPMGETLISFGPSGQAILQQALAQLGDKTVAMRAYLSLYVPANNSGYVTITPDQAKAAEKLTPIK